MKKMTAVILLTALAVSLFPGCAAEKASEPPAGEVREILSRDVSGDLLLVVDFLYICYMYP